MEILLYPFDHFCCGHFDESSQDIFKKKELDTKLHRYIYVKIISRTLQRTAVSGITYITKTYFFPCFNNMVRIYFDL